MLEGKLQTYLKEREQKTFRETGSFSPSYYLQEPFLKRAKDRTVLALMSLEKINHVRQKSSFLDKDSSKFYSSLSASKSKRKDIDSAEALMEL